MDVCCHRPFLPGTSLEPAVIPTTQASSFIIIIIITGLTIWGSNLGRSKKIFSSPKRLDLLWVSPSRVLNVYLGEGGGIKWAMMWATHLRLAPRLRMRGSTPLQPPDGVHRDINTNRGTGAGVPATQAVHCSPNAHSVP